MIRRIALATALATSVAPAQDTTSVILLGVGTPRPAATVFGPATAVVVGSRIFLFDAGAGVMHQMATAGLGIYTAKVTGPAGVTIESVEPLNIRLVPTVTVP